MEVREEFLSWRKNMIDIFFYRLTSSNFAASVWDIYFNNISPTWGTCMFQ